MQVASWVVEQPGPPDGPRRRATKTPGPGEVIVEVAGCGVCHTDLGFFYDGVPDAASVSADARPRDQRHASSTPAPAPSDWIGRARRRARRASRAASAPRAAPAAARSARRRSSRATTCTAASARHVRVPARGLCPRARSRRPARQSRPASTSPTSSVVADAVSTPYQAIVRSGLARGRPRGVRRRRRRRRLRRADRRGAGRRASWRSTSTTSGSRRWRARRRAHARTRRRSDVEGAAQAGPRASPTRTACRPGA